MMLSNAFTCTGPYAIMILYGIKRTENRNMLPEPREGRAAISCSKSFCQEEFGRLIAWASVNLPREDFEKLPSWREVKDWPGKIIAVCDYKARDGLNLVLEDGVYKSKPTPKQEWDEGYRFWWDLSNVKCLPEPIPCRGNVGMWQLSESPAAKVEAAVRDRGVHLSAGWTGEAGAGAPMCQDGLTVRMWLYYQNGVYSALVITKTEYIPL